jgi:hypothetical protein
MRKLAVWLKKSRGTLLADSVEAIDGMPAC